MFPGGIGTSELLVIGVLAVLLFGSKLPEVARNFGRTYQQFRKSLTDLQSSFTSEVSAPAKFDNQSQKIANYKDAVDEFEAPPPRFEPPTASSENQSPPETESSSKAE
jgi:sec-independent protein translocase protein TatA